jgi:hypothetical protein
MLVCVTEIEKTMMANAETRLLAGNYYVAHNLDNRFGGLMHRQ